MTTPKIDVPPAPAVVAIADRPGQAQPTVESCAQIKKLGFTTSKHIKMYGERFEIVSDPITEGSCVVVQAISDTDPRVRTLRLPVGILIGLAGRFLKTPNSTLQ